MNKQKQQPTAEQIEKAQDSLNLMALGQEAPLTYDQAFEILEAADVEKMRLANADVLKLSEMKEGVYSFLFEGFENCTFDGKSMEAARLRDLEGRNYVCPATVVVNSLKNQTVMTLPAYIKIKLKGMKKSAKGAYADVDVYIM